MITGILAGAFFTGIARPQQECTYSESCLPSECAIADLNHGGQKCVPKQVAYLVWDRHENCLEKVELTNQSRMEAPMIDGEPDNSKAVLLHVVATLKKDCGHVEIRSVK